MTTIQHTDRYAPTHTVGVVYDETSRAEALGNPTALRWRAECTCGWTGGLHNEPGLAEVEGDEHRDRQAGPGDGLDAVMSDLLDLQDDLAAMVVWLAENWSADLPVPNVYGRAGDARERGTARIELLVYCADPADLARIAGLLGVPAIDEETPDDRGNRYRNARRHFGRVTLRAFSTLPRPWATAAHPGPAA